MLLLKNKMFFALFLSLTFEKGYKCIQLTETPHYLLEDNNTYYFYFQNGDTFNPNQIEILYNFSDRTEKIVPQQGNAYSFTNSHLEIRASNENVSELLCFWTIPKDECPEDSYVLSTTEQLSVTAKTSRFCYFTSYLFTSGIISLTASNFVDSSNDFRYYSAYAPSSSVYATNGISYSIKDPLLLQGFLEDTVGDNIEVLFSTMNNKKVYKPSQCEVIKFKNYGEKKTAKNVVPKFECRNLNDAAFSTVGYLAAVIIFFSLLMFLLHKCGCINFVSFFSSYNGNDFVAVSNNSDEETMINAFHDDANAQEGQL